MSSRCRSRSSTERWPCRTRCTITVLRSAPRRHGRRDLDGLRSGSSPTLRRERVTEQTLTYPARWRRRSATGCRTWSAPDRDGLRVTAYDLEVRDGSAWRGASRRGDQAVAGRVTTSWPRSTITPRGRMTSASGTSASSLARRLADLVEELRPGSPVESPSRLASDDSPAAYCRPPAFDRAAARSSPPAGTSRRSPRPAPVRAGGHGRDRRRRARRGRAVTLTDDHPAPAALLARRLPNHPIARGKRAQERTEMLQVILDRRRASPRAGPVALPQQGPRRRDRRGRRRAGRDGRPRRRVRSRCTATTCWPPRSTCPAPSRTTTWRATRAARRCRAVGRVTFFAAVRL